MMKIDVIMPTYNSNRPYFRQVLERIKLYAPVHKLIVIDKYSTDGTLEVIKKYFSDALIIQTKASLAQARKIGINYADCEIIAFIDDDVFITERWFRMLYFLMSHFQNIGMIYPLFGLSRPAKKLEIVRRRDDVKAKDLIFKGLSTIRGRTIATMIRRNLVLDWSPPKELHAFEDYHLTQHVLSKGALVVQVNLPLALHVPGNVHASLGAHFKKNAWNAAGIRLTKAMNMLELSIYVASRAIQGLMPNQLGKLRYAGYRSQLHYMAALLGYIVGYLVPYKYLASER